MRVRPAAHKLAAAGVGAGGPPYRARLAPCIKSPDWWRGRSYSVLALPAILSGMKVAEVLRLLQDEGWYLVATRGSHRQFKHANKPGRVTVPGKPSDDLAPGTLNSIRKQASLK